MTAAEDETETELGHQAIELVQQRSREQHRRAKQDRVITILLIGVAIITIVTLVIAALSLPILASGSEAATATKESGDVSACRASYSVLVTEATGRLDDASRQVDLLTNETLQAVLQKDQPVIDRNIPAIVNARELVKKLSDDRDKAVAVYKDAIKRSSDDPKKFLADCRSTPPI